MVAELLGFLGAEYCQERAFVIAQIKPIISASFYTISNPTVGDSKELSVSTKQNFESRRETLRVPCEGCNRRPEIACNDVEHCLRQ